MNEVEWLRSDDVSRMLRTLRSTWQGSEDEFHRRLHAYYLACCRRIWRLLPGDALRMAIEAAERRLDGLTTRDELLDLAWQAEGEMFPVYYDDDTGERDHDCIWKLGTWLNGIADIPPSKLRKLVRTPPGSSELSLVQILRDAGSFAFRVVHYEGSYSFQFYGFRLADEYSHLLSAHLLREHFGNPFAPKPQ